MDNYNEKRRRTGKNGLSFKLGGRGPIVGGNTLLQYIKCTLYMTLAY